MEQASTQYRKLFFYPVELERFGDCLNVAISGTFDSDPSKHWKAVQMVPCENPELLLSSKIPKEAFHGNVALYSLNLNNLDLGHKYLYKYIVNGQWLVNPFEPTEFTYDGFENNVLYCNEDTCEPIVPANKILNTLDSETKEQNKLVENNPLDDVKENPPIKVSSATKMCSPKNNTSDLCDTLPGDKLKENSKLHSPDLETQASKTQISVKLENDKPVQTFESLKGDYLKSKGNQSENSFNKHANGGLDHQVTFDINLVLQNCDSSNINTIPFPRNTDFKESNPSVQLELDNSFPPNKQNSSRDVPDLNGTRSIPVDQDLHFPRNENVPFHQDSKVLPDRGSFELDLENKSQNQLNTNILNPTESTLVSHLASTQGKSTKRSLEDNTNTENIQNTSYIPANEDLLPSFSLDLGTDIQKAKPKSNVPSFLPFRSHSFYDSEANQLQDLKKHRIKSFSYSEIGSKIRNPLSSDATTSTSSIITLYSPSYNETFFSKKSASDSICESISSNPNHVYINSCSSKPAKTANDLAHGGLRKPLFLDPLENNILFSETLLLLKNSVPQK
ncbi:hypothetical protein BB560_004361 [Smittium megazygosporum]|uniref:AMP-activated protein kinase glycogen-binding domain-containing protein n=1 Tax=Smittium megazygosporum TaxID=133381 RepID=A0A2T9Z9I3_9FUNG|nr:hypothetical protein BB560_004361 [Smittium megazygosporum]